MTGVSATVFVISLSRATERRDHMIRLLSSLGIQAEIVPAIDGESLSADDMRRYDARRAKIYYGSDMSNAEIGCYLSHIGIYKHMVETNIESALILEDDIEVDADMVDLINNVLTCDKEWEVIRLQSALDCVAAPQDKKSIGTTLRVINDRKLCRLDRHVLGACAYLIRKSAAAKLLQFGETIYLPIDHLMDRFWENGILPFVVRPFPVRQSEKFRSLIGARGTEIYRRSTGLSAVRRRAQRASDGINKRMFLAGMNNRLLGLALSALGAPSACRGRETRRLLEGETIHPRGGRRIRDQQCSFT